VFQDADHEHGQGVYHGYGNPKEKEKKVPQVTPANTVVQKWAMMVHVHNALAADAAVMRVGGLGFLAPAWHVMYWGIAYGHTRVEAAFSWLESEVSMAPVDRRNQVMTRQQKQCTLGYRTWKAMHYGKPG
jgi:hypothetical protein